MAVLAFQGLERADVDIHLPQSLHINTVEGTVNGILCEFVRQSLTVI